jgi:hypothetical protein
MQITVTQFQGGVDAQAADPTLVQTSNYLYALCAPYNITAGYILANYMGGGTVVNPQGMTGIISPIRVTEVDFVNATDWNGQNSVNQAVLSNYRLQVFANFLARYLLQGVEWQRTLQGIQILLPGFDATTNQYEFYIDISLY